MKAQKQVFEEAFSLLKRFFTDEECKLLIKKWEREGRLEQMLQLYLSLSQ